jgi:hypothetical protein
LTPKAVGTAKKTQKRLGNYPSSLSVSPHMENVPASALAASKRATIGQKALKRVVKGLDPAKRSPTGPQQVSKGVRKGRIK